MKHHGRGTIKNNLPVCFAAYFRAFLNEHSDELVVLKVYAPWCRACKGLEPKYQQIANSEQYSELPVKFTAMSIQNNKDYIKSIGVLALPTVQFYKRGKLIDNFPCGPSKVPILKKKLAELVNSSIDPETKQLKPSTGEEKELVTEKPIGTPPLGTADDKPKDVPEKERRYLTEEQVQHIRAKIPFFETLSDDDFDAALRSAKILTFDAGSIIMREGNFGRTFYAILDGEIEICQKTAFEDPLIATSDYIGTVINRLRAGDYFGERALITGEPRAASVRVTEPMRCVAFQKEDLPSACVLSGRLSFPANSTEAGHPGAADSEIVETFNEKYGVSMRELDQMEISRQIQESSLVNQKRGSALTPQAIPGVDTDEEVEYEATEEAEDPMLVEFKKKSASIIPLLEKFKLIQLVARCYNYIIDNRAQWGDPAIRRRRSLLIQRLPRSQREEFVEAFKLVDASRDGGISMLELKRVMKSIGEETSEEDLEQMIPQGYHLGSEGEDVMTLEDFMGIMAEAEFYHLFKDVFSSLDKRDAGFVKAADLDRVLSGVRDLISDDQHSIIDVEDKEMMIDYEQFTKMLLGLSL